MKTVNTANTVGKYPNLVAALLVLAASQLMHAQSPYVHRVYDYRPAPGQFVNKLPLYETGDTQADMNRKAEDAIARGNNTLITLGGYGGYGIFGFDHEVLNLAGRYDFRILGNAFYAAANPNGEASREGGSCEPGIVMVSRDANGNGLPDDTWYELAGSEYNKPATLRNYQITYYRPDENKPRVPHPHEPSVNDSEYVRWTTNGHGNGYLYRNIYHPQPYYPQWIDGETLSFNGTKLTDNYIDESGQGAYYVQYALHWGYADNHPNTDNRAGFDIEWAVDNAGNPVRLPGIHFIKVYTAVNQYCGWLGETSTEISGAEDLHLTGGDVAVPVFVSGITLNRTSVDLQPGASVALTAHITPADASNRNITWRSADDAVATVSNTGLVNAVATGTTLVQAITFDGYYIDSCRVNVRSDSPSPGTQPVAVTGVTLNRTQLSLSAGEAWTLVATVTPLDATDKTVAWRSSVPDVAEVTSNGTVVALKAGFTTVTATTKEGGYAAYCALTVTAGGSGGGSTGNIAVTGVALSAKQINLQSGQTAVIAATVMPQDATNKAVTWRSSTPAVAQVTVSGTVVAFAVGTATVTATTTDGGFTDFCTVTVTALGNEPVERAEAQVYGKGNTLHVLGLEGFDCRIVSVSGRTIAAFRCVSPDETFRCPLSHGGIYILRARRDGMVITLKFVSFH